MPEEATTEEAVEQVGTPAEDSPSEEVAPSEESTTAELDKLAPSEEEKDSETVAEPSDKETREAESAEPKAEDKPEAKEEKPEEKTQEEAEAEKGMPDSMKQAFRDAPELRGAYFRDKQYTELLGSPENAKYVMEQYEASEDTDKLFLSKNPNDQRQMLSQLMDDHPEETNSLGQLWVQDSHQQYQKQLRSMGRDDLADSLKEIDGVFFGNGTAPPEGVSSEMKVAQAQFEQDKTKFEGERSAYKQEKVNDFLNDIEGSWEKQVEEEVGALLKELKPEGLTTWAEEKLREGVHAKIYKVVNEDKIFVSRMHSAVNGGKLDPSHRKDVLKLMNARSGPLINKIFTGELSKATNQVIQTASEKADKQRRVEARGREPSTTGAPSKPAKAKLGEMKEKAGETSEQFADRLFAEAEAQAQ